MGERVCALLYYYYVFFGGVQWWSVWQKSIVVVYILLKLITIMLYTIELNWFSNDLTWAKQWHYCLLLYSLLLYWIIISRICITDWYFPVHSCVSITLPNCPKLNSWFRVKIVRRVNVRWTSLRNNWRYLKTCLL